MRYRFAVFMARSRHRQDHRYQGRRADRDRVRISGFEEWTFGDDALVVESQGHYDQDDYDRQLEAFYFAFGTDDVYLIVDVPDAAAAAALSMTTSASGAVRVNTTVLITPEEMDEVRTKAVEYRPPGA